MVAGVVGIVVLVAVVIILLFSYNVIGKDLKAKMEGKMGHH